MRCVGCSKNFVNQATAKATLTQMTIIVLRRMESDVEVVVCSLTKFIIELDYLSRIDFSFISGCSRCCLVDGE